MAAGAFLTMKSVVIACRVAMLALSVATKLGLLATNSLIFVISGTKTLSAAFKAGCRRNIALSELG